MLKEFLEKLIELKKPDTLVVDGFTYNVSRGNFERVTTPHPDVIAVHTLNGLVELAKAKPEEMDPTACALLVEDFKTVKVIALKSDRFGRRPEYVRAVLPDVDTFPFGRFMGAEEFIIQAQAGFVDTEALRSMIALVSNLTNEAISTSIDDGLTQTAVVKKGVTTKAEARINPRVKLRAYRTFREVQQPESEFLIRLKQPSGPDSPVQAALFECDGKLWKLDAAAALASWLTGKTSLAVLAA